MRSWIVRLVRYAMVSALDAALPSFSTSLAKASASKMFTRSVIVSTSPVPTCWSTSFLDAGLVLLEVHYLGVPLAHRGAQLHEEAQIGLYTCSSLVFGRRFEER
jgi:hypothetical protein